MISLKASLYLRLVASMATTLSYNSDANVN